MFFTISRPDPDITNRLRRVERKLDLLLTHLGIEEAPDGMDDIRALISEGNKIGAIKEYRRRTGCDLAAAKQTIDSGAF